MIALRDARAGELDALSDLCMRSKAVRGYHAAFVAACRNELTLTAADLAASFLQVATDQDTLVGVAQVSLKGDSAIALAPQ